jgi:NADPH-dependent 2,4-dienoyl-CoA reductase/sulfur reductase-like enzyme
MINLRIFLNFVYLHNMGFEAARIWNIVSDASSICYLCHIHDADKLVGVMKSCVGGNVVVIGGGYIGMECAAALVTNKIRVIVVFPEKHYNK